MLDFQPPPPRKTTNTEVAFAIGSILIGIVLFFLPWISIPYFSINLWEDNYFLLMYPSLRPWLLNAWIKGAISGLGLVNIWLGTIYLAGRARS